MQRRSPAEYNARASTRAVGDQITITNGKSDLTFYPAYTFKASLTWWKWVKLTCLDIHTVLKPHEKYASTTAVSRYVQDGRSSANGRNDPPLLFFYLNHPIQFVQVIGVVVALEEYYDKFWLFTIDDSSGATIDVTCPKPVKEKERDIGTRQAVPNRTNAVNQAATTDTQGESPTADHHLQTTLSTLTIGTVIQAKGTLGTFRSSRQLSLLRLTILPSTTQELSLISSRTQFYASTLSEPWILSSKQERKLYKEAQGERDEEVELARKRRKREQMKREREERHRKFIAHEYEREEEERRQEAERARVWGEELKKKKNKEKLDGKDKESEEVWIIID